MSTGESKEFWVDDRYATRCFACQSPFTFVRRKHHCRRCGQIFCSNCLVVAGREEKICRPCESQRIRVAAAASSRLPLQQLDGSPRDGSMTGRLRPTGLPSNATAAADSAATTPRNVRIVTPEGSARSQTRVSSGSMLKRITSAKRLLLGLSSSVTMGDGGSRGAGSPTGPVPRHAASTDVAAAHTKAFIESTYEYLLSEDSGDDDDGDSDASGGTHLAAIVAAATASITCSGDLDASWTMLSPRSALPTARGGPPRHLYSTLRRQKGVLFTPDGRADLSRLPPHAESAREKDLITYGTYEVPDKSLVNPMRTFLDALGKRVEAEVAGRIVPVPVELKRRVYTACPFARFRKHEVSVESHLFPSAFTQDSLTFPRELVGRLELRPASERTLRGVTLTAATPAGSSSGTTSPAQVASPLLSSLLDMGRPAAGLVLPPAQRMDVVVATLERRCSSHLRMRVRGLLSEAAEVFPCLVEGFTDSGDAAHPAKGEGFPAAQGALAAWEVIVCDLAWNLLTQTQFIPKAMLPAHHFEHPSTPADALSHSGWRQHIAVLCVGGGRIADTEIIPGVAFVQTVTSKLSETAQNDPRVLLLGGDVGIAAPTLATGLSEYIGSYPGWLDKLYSRIRVWRPTVIVVEGSMHHFMADMAAKDGIAVATQVQRGILERLERALNGRIIDNLGSVSIAELRDPAMDPVGGASRLSIEYVGTKPVMMFSGLPRPIFSTLLLRGASEATLEALRAVIEAAIATAFHLTALAHLCVDFNGLLGPTAEMWRLTGSDMPRLAPPPLRLDGAPNNPLTAAGDSDTAAASVSSAKDAAVSEDTPVAAICVGGEEVVWERQRAQSHRPSSPGEGGDDEQRIEVAFREAVSLFSESTMLDPATAVVTPSFGTYFSPDVMRVVAALRPQDRYLARDSIVTTTVTLEMAVPADVEWDRARTSDVANAFLATRHASSLWTREDTTAHFLSTAGGPPPIGHHQRQPSNANGSLRFSSTGNGVAGAAGASGAGGQKANGQPFQAMFFNDPEVYAPGSRKEAAKRSQVFGFYNAHVGDETLYELLQEAANASHNFARMFLHGERAVVLRVVHDYSGTQMSFEADVSNPLGVVCFATCTRCRDIAASSMGSAAASSTSDLGPPLRMNTNGSGGGGTGGGARPRSGSAAASSSGQSPDTSRRSLLDDDIVDSARHLTCCVSHPKPVSVHTLHMSVGALLEVMLNANADPEGASGSSREAFLSVLCGHRLFSDVRLCFELQSSDGKATATVTLGVEDISVNVLVGPSTFLSRDERLERQLREALHQHQQPDAAQAQALLAADADSLLIAGMQSMVLDAAAADAARRRLVEDPALGGLSTTRQTHTTSVEVRGFDTSDALRARSRCHRHVVKSHFLALERQELIANTMEVIQLMSALNYLSFFSVSVLAATGSASAPIVAVSEASADAVQSHPAIAEVCKHSSAGVSFVPLLSTALSGVVRHLSPNVEKGAPGTQATNQPRQLSHRSLSFYGGGALSASSAVVVGALHITPTTLLQMVHDVHNLEQASAFRRQVLDPCVQELVHAYYNTVMTLCTQGLEAARTALATAVSPPIAPPPLRQPAVAPVVALTTQAQQQGETVVVPEIHAADTDAQAPPPPAATAQDAVTLEAHNDGATGAMSRETSGQGSASAVGGATPQQGSSASASLTGSVGDALLPPVGSEPNSSGSSGGRLLSPAAAPAMPAPVVTAPQPAAAVPAAAPQTGLAAAPPPVVAGPPAASPSKKGAGPIAFRPAAIHPQLSHIPGLQSPATSSPGSGSTTPLSSPLTGQGHGGSGPSAAVKPLSLSSIVQLSHTSLGLMRGNDVAYSPRFDCYVRLSEPTSLILLALRSSMPAIWPVAPQQTDLRDVRAEAALGRAPKPRTPDGPAAASASNDPPLDGTVAGISGLAPGDDLDTTGRNTPELLVDDLGDDDPLPIASPRALHTSTGSFGDDVESVASSYDVDELDPLSETMPRVSNMERRSPHVSTSRVGDPSAAPTPVRPWAEGGRRTATPGRQSPGVGGTDDECVEEGLVDGAGALQEDNSFFATTIRDIWRIDTRAASASQDTQPSTVAAEPPTPDRPATKASAAVPPVRMPAPFDEPFVASNTKTAAGAGGAVTAAGPTPVTRAPATILGVQSPTGPGDAPVDDRFFISGFREALDILYGVSRRATASSSTRLFEFQDTLLVNDDAAVHQLNALAAAAVTAINQNVPPTFQPDQLTIANTSAATVSPLSGMPTGIIKVANAAYRTAAAPLRWAAHGLEVATERLVHPPSGHSTTASPAQPATPTSPALPTSAAAASSPMAPLSSAAGAATFAGPRGAGAAEASVNVATTSYRTVLVEALFPLHFAALRYLYADGCPEDILVSLLRCTDFRPGSGQSHARGKAFYKTADERYILKQVKETELRHFVEFGPRYFAHMGRMYEEQQDIAEQVYGCPPPPSSAAAARTQSNSAAINGQGQATGASSKEEPPRVASSQIPAKHTIRSLLVKTLGVFSVTVTARRRKGDKAPTRGGEGRFFILMENLLMSSRMRLQSSYDLKGSQMNRLAAEAAVPRGLAADGAQRALMDMNLNHRLKGGFFFYVREEDRSWLSFVTARDAECLADSRIMDYSMICGLERNPTEGRYHAGEGTGTMVIDARPVQATTTLRGKRPASPGTKPLGGFASSSSPPRSPRRRIPDPANTTASNSSGSPTASASPVQFENDLAALPLLHLGMIDYLHPYTFPKRIETHLKALANRIGGAAVGADAAIDDVYTAPTVIEPADYKARFERFMNMYFCAVPSKLSPLKRSLSRSAYNAIRPSGGGGAAAAVSQQQLQQQQRIKAAMTAAAAVSANGGNGSSGGGDGAGPSEGVASVFQDALLMDNSSFVIRRPRSGTVKGRSQPLK